jgi:NAD(P)-dependent dehydrogenase (short-subunit alcohol dehydrogenase family)
MTDSFDFPDAPDPAALADRVFVVAGGASGIGQATAAYLADAGAAVVVNDVAENEAVVESVRDRGGTAIGHFGDVTSLSYTESLVADTVAEFGRLDGVANFAGVLRDTYLTEMSGEEWDQVVDVHLRGHFSLLRNAARHWRDRAETDPPESQRSFLTVTSRQALGAVGQANYAAAKAGILGLTWTAAAELARYDVRVNALMPLAFTDMIASIPEAQRPEDWTRERMPPGKVAPVSAYLLSDEAAAVSGCVVRSHADMVGLVSSPEITPVAFREGGWTLEGLAEQFEDTLGSEASLDRTG